MPVVRAPQRSSTNDSNPLQRDERLNSIYDKYYAYDPKDLASSDPAIRQLARQASQRLQQQLNSGNPNTNALSVIGDEDEERSTNSANSRPTTAISMSSSSRAQAAPQQQQRKKAGFAADTKTEDAASSSYKAQGTHKREDSAGGVWAGFITGGVADDSDSDSDDDKSPTRVAAAQQQDSSSSRNAARASWTSRAAAVGSRPPDSASQNPLSLKLLGLKSLKDGGAPIGRSPTDRSFDIVAAPPRTLQDSRQPVAAAAAPQQQSHERTLRTRAQLLISEEAKSRILSTSDYGDNDGDEDVGRHGSTIDFGGDQSILQSYMDEPEAPAPQNKSGRGVQLSDVPVAPISITRAPDEPFRSPEMPQQREGLSAQSARGVGAGSDSANRPISPRTALTRQLGLATSSPQPEVNSGSRAGERADYFGPGATAASSPTRPKPSGTPPFQYSTSANPSQVPSSSPPRSGQPMPPPAAAMQRGLPPPIAASDPFGGGAGIPLQRGPPPGVNQASMSPPANRMPMPAPQAPPGSQGHAPPPAALRSGPAGGAPQPPAPAAMPPRGSPPQYASNGAPGPRGGPPPGAAPPNGYRGPPPPPQQQQQRGPPPNFPQPRPAPGPGFSDSGRQAGGARRPQQTGPPGQQRRSNVFRRSMAFMTGQGSQLGPQQQQQQQYGNMPGSNAGGPSRQGNPNRRSMFRRSMAFFTGRPGPPAPPRQPAPAPVEDDDANAPQPRVRGFVDPDEKPLNRKSQYLGAGGMGDEWDVSGAGSKFWRRFSQAQRAAQKPDPMSQKWRMRALSGRKRVNCLAILGLLAIIGAIAGIIIWREGKQKTTDTPGSINRADFGGTMVSGASLTPETVGDVSVPRSTSTSRRRHTRTNDRRDDMVATPIVTSGAARPTSFVETVKGQVEEVAPRRQDAHPLPRRSLRRLDAGDASLHPRRRHSHVAR